ncbi:hypothetical protein SELMODRAFT_79615 [Selaginella moellendorffii]|uniref:SAUR family protein n=2 Tax=Selaginella moellendorffii TaxID=88036 RepID=D8QXW3_SELML|nr:hypothetical protein SELMODRAFT_79615 [Selaginella moellendorffii]
MISHKLPYEGTFVVYVGKERRRYVLGEHYLQMPLFRSLLDKSKPNSTSGEQQDAGDCGLFVPCEIVMFEHLLWMLDSGNGNSIGAVEELVEFYAY